MNTPHTVGTLALAGLGLLLACGSDSPGTGPNGITINGVVRDPVGEPINDAVVLVPGKSPVTTAADGRFSIPDITPPYDIEVFVRSENTVEIYKGLNRSDPILDWWVSDAGPTQTATISGTVPPANPVTTVFFVGVGPTVVGGGNADPTTGRYTFTVSWHGSTTSHAGVLYLLRWQPQPVLHVGTVPASYNGYASKPLTITAGGTFAGNDFAASEVTDPPEQSITVSVLVPAGSPPQGFTLNSQALDLEFGEGHVEWTQVSKPSEIPFGIIPNPFTYTVPAIAGVVFGVYADAYQSDHGWTHFFKGDIPGNSTGVIVTLEEPSHLLAPADSATAIDATTLFSWSQGGGAGVNIFQVIPDDAAKPSLYMLTSATDATLPDLAGTGIRWPAGASYHWFVERDFPLASVDEAAGDWYWNGDFGERGWTSSEPHSFTTKAVAGAALSGPMVSPNARGAEGLGRPRRLMLRPERRALMTTITERR